MAPASGLKASLLSSWHCCTSRNPPLPKSTDLLIRKVPFQRLARDVLQDLNRPGTYPHFTAALQATSLLAIQESVEAFSVGLFEDANLMAPASGLKASLLSSWHCCTSRNPPLPKSTDLLIRKVPFQRLARDVLQDLNRPGTYPHFTAALQATSLLAIQESVEAFSVGLFEDAN
eukprot:CCRYP_018807-RA/>CCRYP_018807-RA protein AED:0.34 eAED:0.34 QI:0/0/0/1/0/0/2/0/173